MKRKDARPLLPVIAVGPEKFGGRTSVIGTIYVIDDESPDDIAEHMVFCRVPEFVVRQEVPFGWWFPYSSIKPLDEGIANLIDIVPRRKT